MSRIKIIKDGGTVCAKLPKPITNVGSADASNVNITFAIPAGLVYQSSTPTVGTFDGTVWNIPTLAVGAEADIEICFTVADSSVLPLNVPYSTSGDCNSSNDNNKIEVCGLTCADILECGSGSGGGDPETVTTIGAALSGTILTITYVNEDGTQLPVDVDLSSFLDDTDTDTDTTYTLVDNGDGTVSLVGSDGSNSLIDIAAIVKANCPETVTTLAGALSGTDLTITYVNEDGTQTPIVIDLSSLVSAVTQTVTSGVEVAQHTAGSTTTPIFTPISTLTDNGDDTYTYTDEAGTIVTIDASETTTTLTNNGDGTATYTSEDGTVTVLDICAMQNQGGCRPTIVPGAAGTNTYIFDDGFGNTSVINVNEVDMDINSVTLAGSVVTFISEDSTTTTLDICAIVAANCNSTLTVNTDGSLVYVDNAGNTVNVPAPPVSTLTVNPDGSVTHVAGGVTTIIPPPTGNTSSITSITDPDGAIIYTHDDGEGNTVDICVGAKIQDHEGTIVNLNCTPTLFNEDIVFAPDETNPNSVGIGVSGVDYSHSPLNAVTTETNRGVEVSENSNATQRMSHVRASQSSTASGVRSVVDSSVAGNATGAMSYVGASNNATASGNNSAVLASTGNSVAGGARSFVSSSANVQATGAYSSIIGSNNGTATGDRSGLFQTLNSNSTELLATVIASQTGNNNGLASTIISGADINVLAGDRNSVIASGTLDIDGTTNAAIASSTDGAQRLVITADSIQSAAVATGNACLDGEMVGSYSTISGYGEGNWNATIAGEKLVSHDRQLVTGTSNIIQGAVDGVRVREDSRLVVGNGERGQPKNGGVLSAAPSIGAQGAEGRWNAFSVRDDGVTQMMPHAESGMRTQYFATTGAAIAFLNGLGTTNLYGGAHAILGVDNAGTIEYRRFFYNGVTWILDL